MKVVRLIRRITCLLAVALALNSAFVTPVWSQNQAMQLGVYLVVEDLSAAKEFYEQLLGLQPVVENSDFIGYSLAGGLLGIYRSEAFTHDLRRGNNSVVYIRVNDIEHQFARVAEMGVRLVHTEIVREPYISLFMFEDPDGNAIEFYELN